MKDFILNKLFLKLAYMGGGLLAGHVIGFLALAHTQAILGQFFKDPSLLPGAAGRLEAYISSGVALLSVFASHYFHEEVVLPRVKPGEIVKLA